MSYVVWKFDDMSCDEVKRKSAAVPGYPIMESPKKKKKKKKLR